MIRALVFGFGTGIIVFAMFAGAFAKGCPIFDVEHDTILGF